MAISVTPKGANAIDGNFGAFGTTHTISSAALGAGDILVFVSGDPINPDVTGVTVDGVTAGFIGKTTNNQGWCYLAQGVTNATGNIVITHNFGWNLECANWFLITGHNAASATFTFADLQSGGGSDPQSVTGTIPSGGVGLMCISMNGSTTARVPATWTGCVSSGNTTLEASVATGNGSDIAGNYSTTAGSGPFTASGTNTYASQNLEVMMVTFSASGGAALVSGWDYIVDDVYPKRALGFSSAPAFVSTFRTAGIAGIAWQGPRDHAKLPPSVVFSTPPAAPPRGPAPQTFGWNNQQEPPPLKKLYLDSAPAFGRALTASPVGISGMAWDTLKEVDKLPKGGFLTDPAPVPFIPQTSTWSFLVGDTTFIPDAPRDWPPGYGAPSFAAPVGISGMAWQTPLDWSKPRISFTTPPAYAVNVAPVVNTNAGIPWFEPPDRDRPATKVSVESPIAYERPPTVFTPISGIAWPAGQCRVRMRARISP